MLSEGDRVISNTGIIGYVQCAGPYGDQPFQIRAHKGMRFFGFVNDDGTEAYSRRTWKKYPE